jgi:hypothetical protein
MSWWRKRWHAETWVRDRDRTERRQRRRRRLGRVVGFLGLLLIGGPGVFVGVVCSGGGRQPPRELIAPFPMPARDESLTFLAVPERLVVAQADEFARHLASRPPSTFPHVTAAREYWGAYQAACGVTTREYAFNPGQQITLALLGAGHTAEQLLKGAYEATVGRVTEWLATTDTPEDRFAAEVARDLARFTHGAPWQQFPFGARLQALWASTPWWGPHVIRKWERRAMLSVEYGVKALCASVARLVAPTAADKDVVRLHAWIGRTTPDVLRAHGAELVSTVGPDSFNVTLPRGEAFTRSILGLAAAGARILDVAGNDEIAITAIARQPIDRADRPPAGALLSVDPLLTDPAARRLTLRAPLPQLADVAAWLQGRGATIEHVFDY